MKRPASWRILYKRTTYFIFTLNGLERNSYIPGRRKGGGERGGGEGEGEKGVVWLKTIDQVQDQDDLLQHGSVPGGPQEPQHHRGRHPRVQG